MINSFLGGVQLTKPNHELALKLGMKPQDADIAVATMLCADLTAILNALVVTYGLNEALDMWYKAVEVYAEAEKMKGE